jgi:hypothetical protein
MKEKNWKDLCEEIVVESDSEKLLSLVHRLNEALDDRKENPRTDTIATKTDS